MLRSVIILAVSVVVLTACKQKAPPAGAASVIPAASSVALPSPDTPPPSASSPSDGGSAVDASSTTSRVRAFFAGYKDGSDYSFLRAACASPVERFITMKSVDIGAVVASARHFFADKRGVRYVPDEKALRVSHRDGGDVVEVPLTMVWGTLPLAEWSSDDPRNSVHELLHAFADAGVTSPLWDGLVEHTTTVDVELRFDGQGRITRYVEGPPIRPKLKFHSDAACEDTFGFATARPDGEVVTDLGEVYATEFSTKGPQVARHVRLRDGSDAWVQDTRSYAVDNPAGGTSAGFSQCLVPADAK